MSAKKTVLLVSPYASRLGHGAFHAQRTAQAFVNATEWWPILLTGRGFANRVVGERLSGEVVEAPVDYGSVGTYRNPLQAVRWGVRRGVLERALLRNVEALLQRRNIDAVLFLDGDVSAIYECWARNKVTHPQVGWAVAHSTTDFWLSELSVRSVYKSLVAGRVRTLTEHGGATVLYCGTRLRDQFCDRLRISEQARRRIVLTSYGSDPDDMRLPRAVARQALQIPMTAKVALFFGLMRKDKRPRVAVDCVALAQGDWWLLLAGQPYSYSAQTIESWVREAGIQHRARSLLRYLDENEVRLVFSAADVLLCTHGRSTVSASGPLNMARSYRLPAIVSDTGFLGDTVREHGVGLLASRGDPQSFAAQLRRYAEMSSAERSGLESRIEEAAHRFSFDCVARRYSEALDIAVSYARAK